MLVAIAGFGLAVGQVTPADSVFGLEAFGRTDILDALPEDAKQIFGANRIAENADELPIRTYIVSNKEIRRNGYATLVDVLKNIPGFRTSQPGEALLGETFLMRGLLGNFYTKILINGIPLDPSAAKGMILAANLPVRQAQRIEIIVGPAAALYGADAMAGVINIVLSDIERPVEAMGSVALGNAGTTEMHLSLGGKFGKRKNVLNYNIYGSYKSMRDIGMLYTDDLVSVDDSSIALESPYWRAADTADPLVPSIRDFPHESRLIGATLKFRDFTLNSNTLFRSDNVAIGSHPEDISYEFPHGKISDYIYANRLRWEHDFGKLTLRTNASSVIYEIDETSEYQGVAHPISAGRNHLYAESNDFLLEQLAFYQLSKRTSFMGGVTAQFLSGAAFQGFLQNPFDSTSVRFDSMQDEFVVLNSADDFSAISPVGIWNEYFETELGAFLQMNYRTKKFHFTLGGRLDRSEVERDLVFSPKVGLFWKPRERIRLRAFFGSAFRQPSTYYRFNNYREVNVPMGPNDELEPLLVRTEVDLEEERLSSIEVGAVFDISKNLRATVHAFAHSLSNSIFPSQQFSTRLGQDVDSGGPPPQPDPNADSTLVEDNLFGFNNANSRSELAAIQAEINYTGKVLRVDLSGQYNIAQEAIEGVDTISGYRSLPQFMGRANVHLETKKGFCISVYSQFFSGFTWGISQINDEIETNTSAPFYNIDFVVSQDFTTRFMGYFRMTNVTQSASRGIFTTDVSGYQFDYMPQQARLFTLGLTYHLP
ncbi:MAG: TonB-dependent receptor [Bacteroidota bacterium]